MIPFKSTPSYLCPYHLHVRDVLVVAIKVAREIETQEGVHLLGVSQRQPRREWLQSQRKLRSLGASKSPSSLLQRPLALRLPPRTPILLKKASKVVALRPRQLSRETHSPLALANYADYLMVSVTCSRRRSTTAAYLVVSTIV